MVLEGWGKALMQGSVEGEERQGVAEGVGKGERDLSIEPACAMG